MNTFNVDFSESIAKAKEDKVLNRPFKTGKKQPAYAVFARHGEEIVKVEFDACASTESGPRHTSQYWGSKVNTALAEKGDSTETLDDLCNFFTEKVKNPDDYKDWNGYTFYREKDILASMPELKNVAPIYTLQIAENKSKGSPASNTLYNSEVQDKLKAQRSA